MSTFELSSFWIASAVFGLAYAYILTRTVAWAYFKEKLNYHENVLRTLANHGGNRDGTSVKRP